MMGRSYTVLQHTMARESPQYRCTLKMATCSPQVFSNFPNFIASEFLSVLHNSFPPISSGEDMNVVVWRVSPYVQECLSQQLSFHCDQPLAYLAALGPQLALAFQERNSGTYNLMHFNTDNHSSHPTKDGHLDPFTGHKK